MISESEREVIEIRTSLRKLLRLQGALKPDVMNDEPPKISNLIYFVGAALTALDGISDNLK